MVVDRNLAPAWPNLAKAAEIAGVHQASLQRTGLQLTILPAGRKEKLVSPTSVLAATLHYLRRPLREAASELIAVATEKSPDLAEAVAAEVDRFLDLHQRAPSESAEDLLRELEATLPPRLYRRVEATYRRERPKEPAESKPRTPRKAAGEGSRTPRKALI